MKLSIGMMVKNEEKNLERCLTSLQPLLKAVSSELIIVDTGSTDNTVDIARKFTAKIYFHPWENDYSKMRNFTVNYAQGEWFFFIDADEELVEFEAIVDFLTTNKSTQYNAAFVKINNFFNTEDQSEYGSALVGRLFRKTEAFQFRGVVHEVPLFNPPLIWLDALLIHYGYVNNDPALRTRKFELYNHILSEALEKEPENIGLWYYLAQTYATYKDQKEALQPAIKAYEIIKKKKLRPADHTYIYITLSTLYLINGDIAKTEQIAEEGLRNKEWAIDLWFNLGKAQAMMKKNEKAINSYKKYLYYIEHQNKYIGKDTKIISATITKKEEVYLDLSVLYKETNNKSQAIKELQEIKSSNMLQKAMGNALWLFLDLERYQELKEFRERTKQLENEELDKAFYQTLESLLLNPYSEQRTEVYKIFQDEPAEYGLLNKIRLIGEKESVDDSLIGRINELEFNKLGNFYGDIFYFLIQREIPLHSIDYAFLEENLEAFFKYLTDKYSNVSVMFYDYLKNRKEESQSKGLSLEEMRINRIMQRMILQTNSLEEENYEWVLDCYIQDGIKYIRQIYKEDILNNGKPYLLRNREDIFFMYMSLAKSVEEKNKAEYVRTLKKALLAYPDLKNGIEFLLNKLTQQPGIQSGIQPAIQPAINKEMQAYAKIVKDNIKQFIDQGLFKEAEEIIRGYEEIVPNDPDIYEMRAYITS